MWHELVAVDSLECQLDYEHDPRVRGILGQLFDTYFLSESMRSGDSVFYLCDSSYAKFPSRTCRDIAALRRFMLREFFGSLGARNQKQEKIQEAIAALQTLLYNHLGSATYRGDLIELLPLLFSQVRSTDTTAKAAVFEFTYRQLRDCCHYAQQHSVFDDASIESGACAHAPCQPWRLY